MEKTDAKYRSIVGHQQGARKIHVHATELHHCEGWGRQHAHPAEEAIYILEGEAEFTFAGKTHRVGPGEAVFFPSGVTHAETRFFADHMKYLVIRTVEPGEAPCCCGMDRPDEVADEKAVGSSESAP
jgi:uncharacterized cupin superfamily protein